MAPSANGPTTLARSAMDTRLVGLAWWGTQEHGQGQAAMCVGQPPVGTTWHAHALPGKLGKIERLILGVIRDRRDGGTGCAGPVHLESVKR